MNFLDVRTVMVSHLATDVICTWVVILLWLHSRKRFNGTFLWVIDFVFQTTAVFLVVLRGTIPDWMSMVLSNTLIIAGTLAGYMGLERFGEKPGRQIHNYVLLAAFPLIHTFFAFVQPNLTGRNLILSIALSIICFQCVWLVFRRVQTGLRRVMRGVGMVFGIFFLISILRIIFLLAGPRPDDDFFKSGTFDTLILISYQLLLIFLAYNLTLMVNRSLVLDIQFQEEKFAKAFRSSPYAMTLTRASDGRIIEVNEAFVQITGYESREVIGKTTFEFRLWVNEEDRVAVVGELSKGGKMQGREFLFRIKSGAIVIGLFSAEIITINQQAFILSSISDITNRKKAEEALRESEERYRQVVENASEGILVAQNGRIKYHNPKIEELIGYSTEELTAAPFTEFIHPEDRGLVFERYQKRLTGEDLPQIYPFRIIDKQGNIKWMEINSVVFSWNGKPATLNFLNDITKRKAMEEQLNKMIIIDELTGLYNRRGFLALSQQQLKVAERAKKEMLLFFADIDNMKWINDNLGHQEGDKALMDIAAILKETFRESDIISRMGGDEYAVLALDTADLDPDILISRLESTLEGFNRKGTKPFRLSLSVGMACYHPDDTPTIDQLLAEADRLMYEQKRKIKTLPAIENGSAEDPGRRIPS
ncbi:MAG: PAS domain S-box protein [Deltaproteobacteria bacterium]|nr:PAS domain S-box protein [Deltaproteobacteria bacterium]